MTFIDLFAGIGGFRLGMEQAGFSCVFSAEIDKHACEMYQANFGDNPYCDVSKLDPATLPDFDVLCAGFPCQPFSSAGKKKGFEDTRGTLFFDIARILKEKQPKAFILENVKNLLKHDRGNTLTTILATLEGLGYTVSYKVLNACDFGVPQSRERIILVGILKATNVFQFPTCSPTSTSFADILEANIPPENTQGHTLIEHPVRQKSGLIFVGYLNKNMRKTGVKEGQAHLSRSHRQPNRIYSSKGTHPTLNSQESSGRYWIEHAGSIRRLTLLECYRLMGFPDTFIKPGNKGNLYRRIGNSVCVPMIAQVARALKRHLENLDG